MQMFLMKWIAVSLGKFWSKAACEGRKKANVVGLQN